MAAVHLPCPPLAVRLGHCSGVQIGLLDLPAKCLINYFAFKLTPIFIGANIDGYVTSLCLEIICTLQKNGVQG